MLISFMEGEILEATQISLFLSVLHWWYIKNIFKNQIER